MAAQAAQSVPVDAWLPWLIGTEELQLIRSGREQLLSDGAFVHADGSGRRWPAGTFSWPSVAELRRRVEELPARQEGAAKQAAQLTVVDGVDIGKLQATLKTEDEAMVQIASNFNCLENPSRGCPPDYGHLVEGYATDSTQGPAASFGVPAASLLRAHYAFHDPAAPPEQWGQTADRQVDLLEDVRGYFGRCVNGKATFDGSEDPLRPEDVSGVSERIKVGVHVGAQVVFDRGSRTTLRVLEEPFPVVDQVLSASVNWYSPGVKPPEEQLVTLTRAALRAAYDGAYLAAICRGRRLLLLTLVGGGSFSNPEELILEELAAAHARWASHPASALEEVRLCLYPRGAAKWVDKSLERLSRAS